MSLDSDSPAFFDEFFVGVDTPLDDKVPEVGTGWTRVLGNYGDMEVNAPNDCLRVTADPCVYYCDDQGTPDHYTAVEHLTFTASLELNVACIRLVDFDNYIGFVGRGTGGGGARLVLNVNGTSQNLIQFQGTAGNYYRVEAEGDQVKLLESAPTDPPSWTQVGETQTIPEHITETRQGVRGGNNTTANWLGQFAAGTLAGPPPGTTLTLGDLSQPHSLDSPSVTQAHALALAGLDQPHSLDSIALSQAYAVAVLGLRQDHQLASTALTQAHAVALGNLDQAQRLDAVTLTLAGDISLGNLRQPHELDSAALTQAYALALSALTQAHTLDSVTATPAGLLVLEALRQAHSLDGVNLTQAHVVPLGNLWQDQVLEAVSLGLVVVGELAGDVVVYAMIDGQVVSYPVIDGEIYG